MNDSVRTCGDFFSALAKFESAYDKARAVSTAALILPEEEAEGLVRKSSGHLGEAYAPLYQAVIALIDERIRLHLGPTADTLEPPSEEQLGNQESETGVRNSVDESAK